jgi:5'-methylthioinosine phosphorylase
MLALIGGTGLDTIEGLAVESYEDIVTPYGSMSAPIAICTLNDKKIAFLPRHGENHSIPPHLINYRANIWGLSHMAVTDIISIATVGSIKDDLNPGSIVIPSQIIDYTYGREHTFFEGKAEPVNHIDFTYPFTLSLAEHLLKISKGLSLNASLGGAYAAVQGPRLETKAEIDRYERDGATIVGMTCMPEASLARELEINYAAICPVANQAAGRGSSIDGISHQDITQKSKGMMNDVMRIVASLISAYAR